MANKFEKGQHLFFLMCGGKTQLDSQQKPRYYLNRDRARQYAKGDSEIVEYAPVKHGTWKLVRRQADGGEYECSECARKYVFNSFDRSSNYCPNCGAKMGGGNE